MQYEKKEVLLHVIDIYKSFEGREILNNINFEIKNIIRPDRNQGQIISIVGRSGIGKSVLLNILAGFIEPDFGTVLAIREIKAPYIFDQLHITNDGKCYSFGLDLGRSIIGMVPQNYILFRHKTVMGNLKAANKDKTLIAQYLHDFDLVKHKDKYPHQLSGGQRQRVSIIQQILTGNKIILLDEPFSGLDVIILDKVINTLLKLTSQDELLTFILISHDLENSIAISDSVHVLAKPIPDKGATIVKSYDLLEMGLCYTQNVKEMKEFKNLVGEVKSLL